jgi:hypothetical protein
MSQALTPLQLPGPDMKCHYESLRLRVVLAARTVEHVLSIT